MKRLLLILALLVPFIAPAQTRVLVTFMGAYSASQPYNINDMVTYSGTTYISLVSNNTGNTPSSNPSDWSVIGVGSGAGTGTVTSFSAGTLSPLFTTSVATSTTTPALTFSLSTAAADSVFGNPTGSTAAPVFTASPVLTAITAANMTDSALASGNCVQASTGGLLTTIASPCGSGGGGTTTNALTMNNGGSGAASGTTFNGSAAQTISYNTIGAQQALTLTTTGSSGAATLSSGTLNIPQYSGGGGAWSSVTSGANAQTGAFSTAAPWTYSYAGTASTPSMTISGAPYASGTATTNFPQLYLNAGTAPTTFSTHGTEFGANSPSGFTGNFLDYHVNGGGSLFNVNYQGYLTAAEGIFSNLTSGNCVQASTSGLLTTTGSACGSGGGTTTNALTMNNSGSGAASGSTFNGSSAVTLSYNTLGAQQALTLTTTGTSGAATLSAGTINIPNYTTGTNPGWTTVTGGGNNSVTTAFGTAAPWTFSAAGAASTPGMTISGAPYHSGTATTNFPQLYLNSGTAPTTFSTAGTEFGLNAPSGFTGNFLDFHLNGGSSVFGIDYTGAATGLSYSTTGTANGSLTMTYTGTGATAPTTNQVQISPAVSITTPYTISPAAAAATGLVYGTNTSNVEQLSFTTTPTVTSLTDSGLTAANAFRQQLAACSHRPEQLAVLVEAARGPGSPEAVRTR